MGCISAPIAVSFVFFHIQHRLRFSLLRLGMQEDGQAGLQELGGNATLLFYQTPEGNEGRQAYLEKRPPDFSKFHRYP